MWQNVFRIAGTKAAKAGAPDGNGSSTSSREDVDAAASPRPERAPAGSAAPARTERSGQSDSLDALRGVAALGVVLFHFGPLASQLGFPIPLYEAGESGVQLFFVLSGFLIAKSVLSRSFDTRTYTLNRVFRIVPNYWFSMLVALVFVSAAPLQTWYGLRIIVGHVLLLQRLSTSGGDMINRAYWTLSIEWMFYIFMLVLARWVRHPRRGWMLVGSMFIGSLLYKSVLWRHYHGRHLNRFVFFYDQLPGMADQFAWGITIALLLQHPIVVQWARRTSVALTGLVLSLGVLITAGIVRTRYDYWTTREMTVLWPLVFCGAAAGLVLFLPQIEGHFGPWLRRSSLPFLGMISYSLYLYHPMIVRKFSLSFNNGTTSVPGGVYLLLTLAAIFGVAYACYRLVEKPFMDARRRLTRPVAAPAERVVTSGA